LEQEYTLDRRLELNSLITYCNEVILPKLAVLEERRLEIKRKRLISAPVYAVTVFAIVLTIAKVTGRNGFVPHFLFIGFSGAILYYFNGFYNIGKMAKAEIIPDMLSHLGWKHTADLQKSTDFYHLNRNGLVPKWSDKSYEDKIVGEIDDIPFTAHEIHLTHGSGDSEVNHDLFLIKVPSAKKFSGITHIRTKKSKLDFNKKNVKGLDRVKFVSLKFGKLFDVFSTDAVEAQYLLPPNYIETVTSFKEELEGKRPENIHVAFGILAEEISQAFSIEPFCQMKATLESMTFMDGHIYLILGSSDFFEIEKLHLNLNDPMHVDAILNEIELIFKVFDHFKLMMKASVSSET